MSDIKELVENALSSESYFMTLTPEARVQLLAVLVIRRIQADIDEGLPLLLQLRGENEHTQQ